MGKRASTIIAFSLSAALATTTLPAAALAEELGIEEFPSTSQITTTAPTTPSPANDMTGEMSEGPLQTQSDGAPAKTEELSPDPSQNNEPLTVTPDETAGPEPSLEAEAAESGTVGDWGYGTDTIYDAQGQPTRVKTITGYHGSASEITIPSTLGDMQIYGVSGSSWGNVTKITISSGIRQLFPGAFADTSSLRTVVFAPGSCCTEIGSGAFSNTGIVELDMPNSVTTLGANAFMNCGSLTKVRLSDNLSPLISYENTNILGEQFMNVDHYFNPAVFADRVTFEVSSASKNFKQISGSLFSKDGSVLYAYCGTGTTYNVPQGVKIIADSAFRRNSSDNTVTGVTLPNTLETIGQRAFQATRLQSIRIPGSVRRIDAAAFLVCNDLRSVYFEDGLRDLGIKGGENQFLECANLASVRLPETLEAVGHQSFFGCDSLGSIDIPASTKTIRAQAFANCYNLATVSGCEGLVSLERNSFANTSLRTFPWGNNLSYVNKSAFASCPNFTGPDHPSYLTSEDGEAYLTYDDTYVLSGEADYDLAKQVLDLVNKERAKAGRAPIVMDASLQRFAMRRAAEISLLFGHTLPSGQSYFAANNAVSEENIAAGNETAETIMSQWMSSPTHKSNILADNVKCVGIGCVLVGSSMYWTQCFGNGNGSGTSDGTGRKHVAYDTDISYRTIKLDGSGFNLNMQLGSSMELAAGEKFQLQVGVMNSGRSRVYCPVDPATYTWSSSNPSAVSVSGTGEVTARRANAEATITAVTKGGKSYKMRVTTRAAGGSSSNPAPSPSNSQASRRFPDVPEGSWYYNVVYQAVGLGLFNGYSDGRFGPTDQITRGQAAVVLWNMTGKPAARGTAKAFPDVATEDYFYNAVRWASSVGVVSGYANGKFGPNDKVTREQLAAMLANYAATVSGKSMSGSPADYKSMQDAGRVSSWATKSVGWCFRNKIISGTKDGRVNPQGNTTRAEASKMMTCLHNLR